MAGNVCHLAGLLFLVDEYCKSVAYTGNVNPVKLSEYFRVTAVDTEKVRHRKKYNIFFHPEGAVEDR